MALLSRHAEIVWHVCVVALLLLLPAGMSCRSTSWMPCLAARRSWRSCTSQVCVLVTVCYRNLTVKGYRDGCSSA
jgi:hypothetical protein